MRDEDLPLSFAVPPEIRGKRLDAALAMVLPEMGLRGRRRLCSRRRVTVNGRARAPGVAVDEGDIVRIIPLDEATKTLSPAAPASAVRLVAASGEFIALRKPRGLHSAHIAGGDKPSLESLLGNFARPGETRLTEVLSVAPILLTRLDEDTSGIVLAALSEAAAKRFRAAERSGLISKHYFAVLRGRLTRPLLILNRLATDNRRKTRVLEEPDPDAARHTMARPLAALDGGAMTLAHVAIRRGARHQIRAHLAAAGFPLAGDPLYAPEAREKPALFRLHHARVEFPGFSALDMPGWNLGENAAHATRLRHDDSYCPHQNQSGNDL
jgi:23S rRNA pseudouridine1911/1915/1917 synthase